MEKNNAICIWFQEYFSELQDKTNLVFSLKDGGTFRNTKDHLYDHKDEYSSTLYNIFSGNISLPEERIREFYKTTLDVKVFVNNVLV